MGAHRREQISKHFLSNIRLGVGWGKKAWRQLWVKIIKIGLHSIQIPMIKDKTIFCHLGLKSLINTSLLQNLPSTSPSNQPNKQTIQETYSGLFKPKSYRPVNRLQNFISYCIELHNKPIQYLEWWLQSYKWEPREFSLSRLGISRNPPY